MFKICFRPRDYEVLIRVCLKLDFSPSVSKDGLQSECVEGWTSVLVCLRMDFSPSVSKDGLQSECVLRMDFSPSVSKDGLQFSLCCRRGRCSLSLASTPQRWETEVVLTGHPGEHMSSSSY